ncbi:murein L,D-transpeptidase [Lysobacter sp. MMG2]|uniref:L,D-transpeptidase family protein n=1 Tax=Lysobacter sp. MMG2 TaxID=2801338 RepID=UPI001C21854B|nr:murein L,D-transpeptidase family protein [Lysobacter sp. MMG2]MBU8977424.1 murein L,D-transpeptidase [Lysobacter sp. MMG2]
MRRVALLLGALVLALSPGLTSALTRTIPSSARSVAAEARVRPALQRDLASAGLRYGAPVLVRIFKLEGELEVWIDSGRGYRLFRTYPVCRYSGQLGPKLRTGDGQAPEGIYRISPKQLNPNSTYHLSFDLGYPNAYDRSHGRTGSYLMVHGNCVSIGCYAMGDASIEEIYSLVAAALRDGQPSVAVFALPFRFDGAGATQRLRDPTWGDFWRQLKRIDDAFVQTHRVPAISVSGGEYRLTPQR